MTQLYDFKNKVKKEELNKAAKCIIEDGLVVFPTETVYGIGANALVKEAVDKIYVAKGRPSDNPLIVHICDFDMLNNVTNGYNEIENKLMKAFWPGPMTIILKKSELVPYNVTCNLDTVGVRMPSNIIAKELIKLANVPIAAPSANISGKPSGTNVKDIFEELNDRVDIIIDYGNSDIGVESTVLKVINDEVVILRPGKITPEDIENIGLKVRLDSHIFLDVKESENVESPGMKHRHYAPKTETIMVYNQNEEIILNKILEIINENIKLGKKVGIIGFDENEILFKENDEVVYIGYGKKDNLYSVSKNIFSCLRKVDEYDIDVCIIQGIAKKGIGIAIMNRLIRACEYKVIEI